jgi:hypothetical protein
LPFAAHNAHVSLGLPGRFERSAAGEEFCMSGTHETVNFNGQVGNDSYGYLAAGYADIRAMGKGYVAAHEPDTGFASALRGQGVGYTSAIGYGELYSYTQAFTLKSGIFASAFDSKQPVLFEALSYSKGYFHEQGAVLIYMSQAATTIDFAHYGKIFNDINLVLMQPYPGLAGAQGYYGYQIAMDNLRLKLDGATLAHRGHAGRHAHLVPQAHAAFEPHTLPPAESAQAHPSALGVEPSYHSQLIGWGHDPGGGLTSQFALPMADHGFGS